MNLKKLKQAITSFMPANVTRVDNKNDPSSAHSMMLRSMASRKAPTKQQMKSWRPQK